MSREVGAGLCFMTSFRDLGSFYFMSQFKSQLLGSPWKEKENRGLWLEYYHGPGIYHFCAFSLNKIQSQSQMPWAKAGKHGWSVCPQGAWNRCSEHIALLLIWSQTTDSTSVLGYAAASEVFLHGEMMMFISQNWFLMENSKHSQIISQIRIKWSVLFFKIVRYSRDHFSFIPWYWEWVCD